jgi:hypothetical protein
MAIASAKIDAAAALSPACALQFSAHLLTDARLDLCAIAEPCAALRYAAARLSPSRLSACALLCGDFAFRFAVDALVAIDFDFALIAPDFPELALRFAAPYLSAELRLELALAFPAVALRFCADLLPPDFNFNADPCALLRFAGEETPPT